MNRTRDIIIKIDRAKEHIHDLSERIKKFIDLEPYRIEKSDEPNGDLVYRVKVHAQVPLRWSAIIGDAIHNLRAALEYLVWQLVLVNKGKPTHENSFPVCQNVNDFNGNGRKKIQGVPKEAEALIEKWQPYHPGNDLLSKLNQLENIDKHRLLIPVGSAYNSLIIDFGSKLNHLMISQNPDYKGNISLSYALEPANPLYQQIEDGVELYRIFKQARDSHEKEPKFAFEIRFGEGKIVDGEPVLHSLKQLEIFVENLIRSFETFLVI